jgi:hypothetical protein
MKGHFGGLGPPLAAVGAALLLGLGLWMAARWVNRPPVLIEARIEPDTVGPGETALVHVRADDPDGDRLSYSFRADAGRIGVAEAGHPETARYTAPLAGSSDRVGVTIRDARGQTAEAWMSVAIEPRAPEPTPPPGATPTPTPLPAPTPASVVVPTVPPPAATPAPAPRAAANRAPVVDGGQVMSEVGDGLVGLEAQAYDPDGDWVTHAWDYGNCVEAQSSEAKRADVRLRPGCDTGTAILTWTDAHGAAASTLWTITR